jgi:hypothetical protein
MRSEVNVTVDGQAFSFILEGKEPLANEVARTWLDTQFVALECEPIRASGKLLLADKVVAIAREAGARRFVDTAWGGAFAAAASAALGNKVVLVDADALSVSY